MFVMETEVRRCGRCELDLPISCFAWKLKAKGRRDSWCRACRKAYSREYYEANRERYMALDLERKRRARLERTRLLIEYFASHPCVDCGETDPVVLEFDHLRDKDFNIGSKLVHCSWKKVLAEIEKCEVVCANCHRRRTNKRRGAIRSLLVDADRKRVAGIEPVSFSLEG
jgi:5-methylcytosine-specific restriction endonuclease McrA